MIASYALIAAFMLGVYVGSTYERGDRPALGDIPPMFAFSILWPVTLGFILWALATKRG